MTLAPAPNALKVLLDGWEAGGRVSQPGIRWNRHAWHRRFERSGLDVPIPFVGIERVNRDHVTDLARSVADESSALQAFIAAMIWGYGTVGYGPYRTVEVVAANGGLKDLAGQLFEVARIARTQGGVEAYRHIGRVRQESRPYLKHLGPAFGTKFIYFITNATSDVLTTPVMDSIMVSWFREHVPDANLLLSWSSVNSYETYVTHLEAWRRELDLDDVDDVEMLIFSSRWRRETPADLSQAVDAVSACLEAYGQDVRLAATPHLAELRAIAQREE